MQCRLEIDTLINPLLAAGSPSLSLLTYNVPSSRGWKTMPTPTSWLDAAESSWAERAWAPEGPSTSMASMATLTRPPMKLECSEYVYYIWFIFSLHCLDRSDPWTWMRGDYSIDSGSLPLIFFRSRTADIMVRSNNNVFKKIVWLGMEHMIWFGKCLLASSSCWGHFRVVNNLDSVPAVDRGSFSTQHYCIEALPNIIKGSAIKLHANDSEAYICRTFIWILCEWDLRNKVSSPVNIWWYFLLRWPKK